MSNTNQFLINEYKYLLGPTTTNSIGVNAGRAVHERSHSDGTGAPLPSVDLSKESSSVTSLSNLPLRKSIISGEFEKE